MGRSRIAVLAVLAVLALCAVPAAVHAQSKPPAIWKPVHPNNYYAVDYDRGIWYVIIHTIEGRAADAISWFQTSWSGVSTHYVVDYDGTVYQMVADKNIGRHTGHSWWNAHSIGIEHAGYMYRNYWTDAEYRASARITRWVCLTYGIPMNRSRIIGHDEATRPGTDPGPYFNWSYYMSLVANGAGTPTTTLQGMSVTADTLNVRAGAGTGYSVIGQVYSGQRYVAVAASGSWHKIYFRGNAGWCHGGYLSQVTGVTGVRVDTDVLNVRTGPGTGYSVVGTVHSGERYVQITTSNGWRKIYWGGGVYWVYGSYTMPFGL